MDIGAISGFEPVMDRIVRLPTIKRIEMSSGRLVLYFDEVGTPATLFIVKNFNLVLTRLKSEKFWCLLDTSNSGRLSWAAIIMTSASGRHTFSRRYLKALWSFPIFLYFSGNLPKSIRHVLPKCDSDILHVLLYCFACRSQQGLCASVCHSSECHWWLESSHQTPWSTPTTNHVSHPLDLFPRNWSLWPNNVVVFSSRSALYINGFFCLSPAASSIDLPLGFLTCTRPTNVYHMNQSTYVLWVFTNLSSSNIYNSTDSVQSVPTVGVFFITFIL